ncbi:phospholipase D-like domain-containing protein [Aquibium microcysteis]|uniref:phospholipase D-like domain-containing protein n=1 Tax=Aquibium microcysteis TaxID=675281 RepID=UPI001EF3BABA|nr:phospholipase D-like domain-containing protein [Aquibium microcysteis]
MMKPSLSQGNTPLLSAGSNCWRVAHADRAALIVDAADYFRAVKDAFLKARHSIYLIGWDFDTRISFEPEGAELEGPNQLGPCLRWLVKHRPDLNVYILKWDLGTLFALGRGTTPFALLGWTTNRRLHFKLDRMHPPGAAHHQKIVVVDDVLAFCGGIDMTADRWDTREHLDEDPRRVRPSGRSYGPWHDATAAVDDGAARALGDLARERWRRATGEELEPPPPSQAAIWPARIEPTFRNVTLGIARTMPGDDDTDDVREVERLTLDAVRAARHTIYCESQYFASRAVAEAIASRLVEKDGPEIVIINPLSADGFLEAEVMDSSRAQMFDIVRQADMYERFRIFTPVAEGGRPIYVHAKILVVDDVLFRIGSSNLNNRSMGFDTECDLVIEAAPEDADLRRRIADVADDLLAEHLGCEPQVVRKARLDRNGSLIAAIDALRGSGRTLQPFEPAPINAAEEKLAESDALDPERPPRLLRSLLSSLRSHASNFR